MPPDGAKIAAPPINDGRILFMARTLQDLCERIGKITGRSVIDKTGLTGRYVIVLTYLPLNSTNSDPSDPGSDIFLGSARPVGAATRTAARTG